jgi:hypothetical protein
MGGDKFGRYAAEATHRAMRFTKGKVKRLLGLDRKSFKFHSLPVESHYYQKSYLDDFKV